MTRDRRILGLRINIKAHFDVWFISFSGLMFTLINDYSYNFNIKTVRIILGWNMNLVRISTNLSFMKNMI